MLIALFSYDIILLIVVSMVVTEIWSMYRANKTQAAPWMIAFFVGVILDHCLLFAEEFVPISPPIELVRFEQFVHALVGPLFVFCERKIIGIVSEIPLRRWEYVLFFCVSAFMLADSQFNMHESIVFLVSIAFFFYSRGIFVPPILRLAKGRDSLTETIPKLYLGACCAILSTELVQPFIEGGMSTILLPFSNRSICSELITIECLIITIAYIHEVKMQDANRHISTDNGIDLFAHDYGLSTRESEILKLIVEGRSNQEIAARLWLSLGTVKTHAHNIYRKAGVSRRSDLLWKYSQHSGTTSQPS